MQTRAGFGYRKHGGAAAPPYHGICGRATVPRRRGGLCKPGPGLVIGTHGGAAAPPYHGICGRATVLRRRGGLCKPGPGLVIGTTAERQLRPTLGICGRATVPRRRGVTQSVSRGWLNGARRSGSSALPVCEANHSASARTKIFNESAVGRAARATALAVCSRGKTWEINGLTSSRRENTRRATSACNVKSDE